MFLQNFHRRDGDIVTVSAAQASDFAKTIADDFNPLHDEDAKRFCVPGDLLFSLILRYYGMAEKMQFRFTGMVGDKTPLSFTPCDGDAFAINDGNGKPCVEISRSGNIQAYDENIEAFIKDYVAFSGRNFPHILVPLMEAQNVMINPARPMVMYESMAFELSEPLTSKPSLVLSASELSVDGKRGAVDLRFELMCDGKAVGFGTKHLLLSGLRPYDAEAMDGIRSMYDERKLSFRA